MSPELISQLIAQETTLAISKDHTGKFLQPVTMAQGQIQVCCWSPLLGIVIAVILKVTLKDGEVDTSTKLSRRCFCFPLASIQKKR
uniref:Uncharacterized protein n=1 Tax=Arundo donax TaxID=35708 RepID=A0A0A9BSZ2_ARUDO